MKLSFLEYAAERLMGPPTSRIGGGRSTWTCPQCGDLKFYTLPPKKGTVTRFRCPRCQFSGDAFDLVKEFHSEKTYPWQRVQMEMLQQDYQVEVYYMGEDPPDCWIPPIRSSQLPFPGERLPFGVWRDI